MAEKEDAALKIFMGFLPQWVQNMFGRLPAQVAVR
jgi:hypothetical protein